ncbi:MAG TPA: transcription antitermination factor NusB [Bryobacteraceae bacterium]|nr:transcription antitermination factor NusB [Bryobacteraceae bacterium]
MKSYDLQVDTLRAVAFEVFERVENGGYAADLLDLKTNHLDSRDAGLASEIVFGCLRFQAQLDHLIARYTTLKRLDVEIRIALRMGIYQIRYLERIPKHAAVNESVELVKRARKRSAAALVNAILRKIGREPVEWPDRATALSCPSWLLERWDRNYGEETAASIAGTFLKPAEKHVASTGRRQDIGSQSIVPLLDLQPGQTFLDLCAAPGNKTAQALELGVQAVACDRYLHRIRHVPAQNCRRIVLDATQPLPFSTQFDRVLVDAPCSGTGTLGRNPEIKWRLQPSDLSDLHGRQTRILANALRHVKPGGKLVYSTCSLEPEENEEVIRQFPGEWRSMRRIPGVDAGDGFFAAVVGLDLAPPND